MIKRSMYDDDDGNNDRCMMMTVVMITMPIGNICVSQALFSHGLSVESNPAWFGAGSGELPSGPEPPSGRAPIGPPAPLGAIAMEP